MPASDEIAGAELTRIGCRRLGGSRTLSAVTSTGLGEAVNCSASCLVERKLSEGSLCVGGAGVLTRSVAGSASAGLPCRSSMLASTIYRRNWV